MIKSHTSRARRRALSAAAAVLFCLPAAFAQKADQKRFDAAERRAGKAVKVLADLSALPQAESIPRELLARARAVAVFPDVDKMNLLSVKFMKGSGLVSRRVEGGWSAPAFYGFAVSDRGWTRFKSDEPGVIMLFMDDALFKKDGIKLVAEEGPVGELTPEKEKRIEGAGVLAYALSEGRLRGVSVEDDNTTQTGINSDNNVNKAVYGLKAREVLAGKEPAAPQAPAPPSLAEFRTALSALTKQ